MNQTFDNFQQAWEWFLSNMDDINDNHVVIQEIRVAFLRAKVMPYKRMCEMYRCRNYFVPNNGLQRYCPKCASRLRKQRMVMVNA